MRPTGSLRDEMKKEKKPKVENILPPRPTGGYSSFNSPKPKNNIVAKSQKIRKKI